MAFYESTFIIRQDVSSADVDKIANDFENLIKEYSGEVVKTEYWGLRNLAYEIKNNKKGHYYFIGLKGNNALLAEFNRKVSLSESIIRSSMIRVDEISKEPSYILRSDSSDGEDTIDVTVEKDDI